MHRGVRPEVRERDPVPLEVQELMRPRGPEGLEVRELRILLPVLLVRPLNPPPLRAAFGVDGFKPHLLRDPAADFPGRPLFPLRVHGFVDRRDKGGLTHRVAVSDEILGFVSEGIREEHIRVPAGRGHHVVADHDEFAFRRVAEDLIRAAAVAMLVDEDVAARIDHHLDVVLQPVDTLHTVVRCRHLVPPQNRLCPHEARDRGFHGVIAAGDSDWPPVGAALFHAA